MISPDELPDLYSRILDITREALRLLEEDQVEEAVNLNSAKLELLRSASEINPLPPEFRSQALSFCAQYAELNDLMVRRIGDMKDRIEESLRNRRSSGKKVCTYQSISQVGR